jgi:lipid-A-disaccharide synthase
MDEANPSPVPTEADPKPQALRVFLVAGEHSGDALGARLMAALKVAHRGPLVLTGVGGEEMEREGLASLFPLRDVAVMGPLAIAGRLAPIVRRVYQTVDTAIAAEPDAVVIIDSPELTHPIAKRIRKRRPEIPIVDYVSPSVWAWRPGRAARMRAYVDHVLALLPFEPEAHKRLGGPPCTYVGHPLIERAGAIRSAQADELARRLGLDPAKPVLAVLPGSRSSEVGRLIGVFGEAIAVAQARVGPLEVVLPTLDTVRSLVGEGVQCWPIRPHLVTGEDDKWKAFRLARAALAASGTVTLELALAGTPMVVAYKVDPVAALLRHVVKAHSVVLANLVLGQNAFPEFLQEDATPAKLGAAAADLLIESPARKAQLAALAQIPARLEIDGPQPSAAAARIVLDLARQGRRSAP